MKKQFLLFTSLLLLSLFGLAQNKANLIIFSEDGDGFYAYINGVRQNDKPETNVKITGLSPNVSLRVEFADKALPQLKQTMVLEGGLEHSARIKRDMKKQLKLRYFGQTPIDGAASGGVPTVAYHSVENTPSNAGTANTTNNSMSVNNNAGANVGGTQSTTITSTTTNINTGSAANNDNVAVNMNVGGVGINMNVNGMAPNTGATMNTTTSTTVSSSSSSSYNSSASDNNNQNNNQTNRESHHLQNNNQPVKSGCVVAMSSASFDKMKETVDSKPFSDTKMSTAKVATKNACLSVDQVKEITKLFSMDEDKLTYAKYAYDYCIDKANYYQVSEVFSFSGTTDEFNKFLEQ
jgi:hypothetical protein